MKRAIKIIGLFLILLGVVTACEKENRSGVVSVRMKDHPGHESMFDEVNIEVKQIQLYYVSGPQNRAAWVPLKTQAGVYNVLKFTGGTSIGLVLRERIPAGRVTGIRLMLGEDNSVRAKGQLYPIKIDPAHAGGIGMGINLTVRPDYSTQVMLGFDASSSIVVESPGIYRLKPAIKVIEVLNTTK